MSVNDNVTLLRLTGCSWRLVLSLCLLLWGSLDAFAIRAVHPETPCTGNFGSTVSRARYYSPQIGRFWTMDTYQGDNQDPLSLHKYLYCRGNPANRMDPSGLADYSLTLVYGASGWDDWILGAQLYYETIDGLDNQFRFLGHQQRIVISPIMPADNILQLVKRNIEDRNLVAGTDRIIKIIIVGHGSPGKLGSYNRGGSDLTLENLQDGVDTPQSGMLDSLKPFTDGHCEVDLRACDQALVDGDTGRDGKEMMKLISRRLGATVIGYEDQYAVTAHGNQWTVKPDGSMKMKPGEPFSNSMLYLTKEYLGRLGWNFLGLEGVPW